jgi:hypothetical protein
MANSRRDMNNPFLRRVIWLDENQRSLLSLAAESAIINPKSDSLLCDNVLKEIMLAELDFLRNKNSLVLSAIRGLRLPKTALPIYLCYAEIQEIISYTKVDIEKIKEILDNGNNSV